MTPKQTELKSEGQGGFLFLFFSVHFRFLKYRETGWTELKVWQKNKLINKLIPSNPSRDSGQERRQYQDQFFKMKR